MNDFPDNQPPQSRPLLRAGQVIGGRYRVQALLGRGGMGIVYAAEHELTQRKVALKVVDAAAPDLPSLRDRFLGEARTAAAVRHPNIVDILDMGMHHGAPYLVMELLQGRPLDSIVEEGRELPPHEILSWLFPIMGALATLHDAGIVHRDVKPSNIFLSRSTPREVVPKLLDFGLARAATDARLTRSGVVIGTPVYMSPEHAAGGQVGPATDVWSMGVVLFECFTGSMPYSATDRSVLAAQLLAGHVRPVRQVRPNLPTLLAEAIDGALRRNIGQRHASMRALAQALVQAAVAHGIVLPDAPDPIGLQDFSAWRTAAPKSLPALPVATTAEVVSLPEGYAHAPNAPGAPATRRVRRHRYVALAVILGAFVGTWLFRRTPTEAVQSKPEAPPSNAEAGVTTAAAPPAQEPSVTALESPAKLRTPPADAGTQEAGRTSTGERLRRKRTNERPPTARNKVPSPPAATPPAEVETEWK